MRTMNHFLRMASVGSIGVVIVVVAAGFAQPANDADVPPSARSTPEHRGQEARERRPDIDDPAILRDRIESAIERGERMLERQRAALAQLDAGDSPAEVMRSLRLRRGSESGRGSDEGSERREQPAFSDAPDREALHPEGPGDTDRPRRGLREDRPATDPDRDDGVEPDTETLRALVREHFPELARQLETIAQGNPEAGDRLFMRMAPRIREIALDMRHDPALGQLRIEEVRAGMSVGDATGALRSARSANDDEAVAAASQTLRDAIGRQFDARVALRQHEVERLVGRIGELNDEIVAEIANRDEAIESIYESIVNRRWSRPGRKP